MCLMRGETTSVTEMLTHLIMDYNVWIPTNWTGICTYLVSSLQKRNQCLGDFTLHRTIRGCIQIEMLQCKSCVSSVEECRLCGSSCSLPTLAWSHTSQCTLSEERNILKNKVGLQEWELRFEFFFRYLHFPDNPRGFPCSGGEPQQPDQHSHPGAIKLCRTNDLEVQMERDTARVLHAASADTTVCKGKLSPLSSTQHE